MGLAKGISDGLKVAAQNPTTTIENKFAQILQEAEVVAEKKGFDRGLKDCLKSAAE